MKWYQRTYGIQRKCTCAKGYRSQECTTDGWHLVDGHDDLEYALRDARSLQEDVRVPYRVIVNSTGLTFKP
jgi:hypothetical protein